MDCTKYDVLINKYIDNDISEEEERDLREHINNCEECRVLFNEMRSLSEDTMRLYSNENKIDLKDKIMNEIKDQKKSRRFNIGKIGTAVAVSFAIFFCVPVQGKTLAQHMGEWLESLNIRNENISINVTKNKWNKNHIPSMTNFAIVYDQELRNVKDLMKFEKEKKVVLISDYIPNTYDYSEHKYGRDFSGNGHMVKSIYRNTEKVNGIQETISVEVLNFKDYDYTNKYTLFIDEDESTKSVEILDEIGVLIQDVDRKGVIHYELIMELQEYPTAIKLDYYGFNEEAYEELVKVAESIMSKINKIPIEEYAKIDMGERDNVKHIDYSKFESEKELSVNLSKNFDFEYSISTIPQRYIFEQGGYEFYNERLHGIDWIYNGEKSNLKIDFNFYVLEDASRFTVRDFGYIPGEIISQKEFMGEKINYYEDKVYKNGEVRRALSIGIEEYEMEIEVECIGDKESILSIEELESIMEELIENAINTIEPDGIKNIVIEGRYFHNMEEFKKYDESKEGNFKIPTYIPEGFKFYGAIYDKTEYILWIEDNIMDTQMQVVVTRGYDMNYSEENTIKEVLVNGYKGNMVDVEFGSWRRQDINAGRRHCVKLEVEGINDDVQIYITGSTNNKATKELEEEMIKVAESIIEQYK